MPMMKFATRICHTSVEKSSVKLYATMSATAPPTSSTLGPIVRASRPENGESTIITIPAGMITRLAARSDSPNPPTATGSSSICG